MSTQWTRKPPPVPAPVTAYTFDDLIAEGLKWYDAQPDPKPQPVNGMPWSFMFAGRAWTHESDDRYLYSYGGPGGGSGDFLRGQLLVVEGIYMFACSPEELAAAFDPVQPQE